jgi:DNA-binding transcriptional LysR family regulator
MPILNVEHLLDQAVRLIRPSSAGQRRQVDLRRAISSAYYSVFHAMLTAASDAFVGRTHRTSPRYALVYRGIDHRELRTLCEVARKHPPPLKYRPYVPLSGFGLDLRTFASAVIELQDARHEADYDPRPRVRSSDVTAAIDLARTGLGHWNEAQQDEKVMFLTLLTFPPR